MKTTVPFEITDHLDSEEMIHEYLKQVFENGDQDEINRALGDVAKARGMTAVAKDSGLGRESLYKAIRPGAKPQFSTVRKIASALGMKVTIEAVRERTVDLGTIRVRQSDKWRSDVIASDLSQSRKTAGAKSASRKIK